MKTPSHTLLLHTLLTVLAICAGIARLDGERHGDADLERHRPSLQVPPSAAKGHQQDENERNSGMNTVYSDQWCDQKKLRLL